VSVIYSSWVYVADTLLCLSHCLSVCLSLYVSLSVFMSSSVFPIAALTTAAIEMRKVRRFHEILPARNSA